jgi:hypothetical protein
MSHTEETFLESPDTANMIDAFWLDLCEWFGEAPGQEDAFYELRTYMEGQDGDEIFRYLLGFGLALAETAEDRAAVIEAASFFLVA